MVGGRSIHILKNYGGFCVIQLNGSYNITNYMANSAIILYLGFLLGLISQFEKL